MRRVVHEMRNHLAVAVANVEAFLDGKLEPTPARLTAMRQSLGELDRLIDDLPLADSASSLPAHEPAILDVCRVVANESRAMEGYAAERGVRFRVDHCEVTHPACQAFYGDSQRIGEILTNVLTNAIRYTPAGGSVDVVCRRDAACMEFTVRDDGIGIAATELPRIFERGFRGGGAESQAGSGIGLSLVKDFVDAAGGSIAVESVVAQGSTFTVRLPGSFGRAATVCDCALAHGAQAG